MRDERQVYFMQAGTDGSILISPTPPEERPELRLLGSCEGGAARETELHHRLTPWSIRAAWYEPSEQVLATVQTAIAGE